VTGEGQLTGMDTVADAAREPDVAQPYAELGLRPEEYADIPLFWFNNEVMANPKVVGEWVYPGLGAGRSTHFHMIKPGK